MKKIFALFLAFFLLVSLASAINITVTSEGIEEVLIRESTDPTIYDLTVTNHGPTDSFKIFSFVGVEMTPSENFEIKAGQTETIRVQAYPSEKIRENYRDWFLFEYRIAGEEPGTYRDKLRIKLVPLAEIIEVEPVTIMPDEDELILTVQNLEDKDLDSLTLTFKSGFFEHTEVVSFKPFQQRQITVQINKDIGSIKAGQYVLTTEIEYKDIKAEAESQINYLEQGGIATSRDSSGIIVIKTEVTKENVGNVASLATIEQDKNLVSRLFTTFSSTPTTVERKGFTVKYYWNKELQPGESFSVISTTNYTFPVIFIILIILAIIWVRVQARTDLILKKRIQFVRTRSGEFALRIRIKAKSRKNLTDIRITDIIPGTTKLHDKSTFPPASIDEKTRRIHWNLNSMAKGEERTFSYLIYSKIRIVGSFSLPIAHASYKSDNRQKFVSSNRTSFAAEGN